MNLLQKLSRVIIKKSFYLSVRFIEHFNDVSVYEAKTDELSEYPEGTLGRDIADCLKGNRLRLVPGYESHDLKHTVLDFNMTPEDEIRMQAFMIGNGNYSIPSFAIFLFGALLLPDLWSTFYKDYKRGRKSLPISKWTIEEYAHCQTSLLREKVFDYEPEAKPSLSINTFIKIGAYCEIAAGVFGMIYCLPHLFSSLLVDVVGAGFPFLAGAVLASVGLLTLSKLSQNTTLSLHAQKVSS